MPQPADLTEAVRLDPSNASALFNRGSALDSLGRFDHAIADFTKVGVRGVAREGRRRGFRKEEEEVCKFDHQR